MSSPLQIRKAIFGSLTALLLVSCRVTADRIAGAYRQEDRPGIILLLRKDKTFDFTGPGTNAFATNDSARFYCTTKGSWTFRKRQLFLNSTVSDAVEDETLLTDSIARFTSLSSFNFWNRYGDPLRIRSIQLPSIRNKPHFGNNLFLFAQDFKPTDTIRFHFEGYPDFSYPGSVPYAIGNNNHKIVLKEPFRPALFQNAVFLVKRNAFLGKESRQLFVRKD